MKLGIQVMTSIIGFSKHTSRNTEQLFSGAKRLINLGVAAGMIMKIPKNMINTMPLKARKFEGIIKTH